MTERCRTARTRPQRFERYFVGDGYSFQQPLAFAIDQGGEGNLGQRSVRDQEQALKTIRLQHRRHGREQHLVQSRRLLWLVDRGAGGLDAPDTPDISPCGHRVPPTLYFASESVLFDR